MEQHGIIRLEQRNLKSGKKQVKFYIDDARRPRYGYLLLDEPKPISAIIDEILKRSMRQRGLHALSLHAQDDHCFYMYSA
ncbi:hypothetical protein A3SI_04897 [Nitritalea halalkaliphila LW7]|uniref:Uncharacterized protein n=1 Tax=Nitritalea halalkaliphila LW7 TaxID=1189621 RepID=I5C8F2_9BACT|nr:hypothetical protein [Nitritalea halalkaliphila]EIM78104.1 hypothetical protein A3SI_04897 [Nitritalea halalkaliphila LW7]